MNKPYTPAPIRTRPGGAIFRRRKANEKAPNWGGEVTLDRATLDELVNAFNANQPVVLRLAGWDRQSGKTGEAFIGLAVDKGPPQAAQATPTQTGPQGPSGVAPTGNQGQSGQQGRSLRDDLDDTIPF